MKNKIIPTNFNQKQCYVLKSDVVVQAFEDEGLLLDLNTELIFQLNATGLHLVQLLQQHKTGTAIVAALAESYSGDPQIIQQDVGELLAALLAQDLIQPINA